MADFHIYIGYRTISSWSLRGWLPMSKSGVPFDETLIRYRGARARRGCSTGCRRPARCRSSSTSATAARCSVWDSLAIGEYLAETFPAARLWPARPGGARLRALDRGRDAFRLPGAPRAPVDGAARAPSDGRTTRTPTPTSPASTRSGANAASAGARRMAGRSSSATSPIADAPTRRSSPASAPTASRSIAVGDAYMDGDARRPGFPAWDEQARRTRPPEPLPA